MDATISAVAANEDAAAAAAASLGPKPKRPLSAFNLFYRFKRKKVLDAITAGRNEKEDIAALVGASPGLEDRPEAAIKGEDGKVTPPSELDDLRRADIRSELEGNLLPRDTRDRQHRTNQSAMNGTMSFLELGRHMNASWKACDLFAKSVFDELAEEGRELYRTRIMEYNARAQALGVPSDREKAAKSPVPGAKASKKKKLPTKNNAQDKSPSPQARDDASVGGVKNDVTARVVHHGHGHHMPRHHGEHSGLLDLLSKHRNGPVGGGDHGALLARITAHENSLRTVSADYGQESHPSHHHHHHRPHHHGRHGPSNDGNDANGESGLRARVKELEGQLAAERLRARVRELEGDLARQKSVEEGLRTQLGVFARNVNAAPPQQQYARHQVMVPQVGHHRGPGGQPNHLHHHGGAGGPLPPSSLANPAATSTLQGDGLWSLVSASMIHPSVRAQERTSMLQRMVATRNGVLPQLQPSAPPARSPSEAGAGSTNVREREPSPGDDNVSSNKKQKRSGDI